MDIPSGWRFYSADASIIGSCTVTLMRDKENTNKWHNLSEEDKAVISLYVIGRGDTFEEALSIAISIAKDNLSMDIYHI